MHAFLPYALLLWIARFVEAPDDGPLICRFPRVLCCSKATRNVPCKGMQVSAALPTSKMAGSCQVRDPSPRVSIRTTRLALKYVGTASKYTLQGGYAGSTRSSIDTSYMSHRDPENPPSEKCNLFPFPPCSRSTLPTPPGLHSNSSPPRPPTSKWPASLDDALLSHHVSFLVRFCSRPGRV